MKYELMKRKNLHDVDCISPFIEGWCVWDIPVSGYTTEVELAIKHAYNLGVKHTIDNVTDAISKLSTVRWES